MQVYLKKFQGVVFEKSVDGRTNGRTDEGELLGPIPPSSGDPKLI